MPGAPCPRWRQIFPHARVGTYIDVMNSYKKTCSMLLEAEAAKISGAKTYTIEEVSERLKKLINEV
ncbi:MAG: hypothetical protein AB1815_00125 [Bacillota bacterium]